MHDKHFSRWTTNTEDRDDKITDMSMLQGLAERMGVDLFALTPEAFADLYEEYVAKWDEFHVKEAAVRDVWDAYRTHRQDRPNSGINTAIQVGFAHGLSLNDIHAILGVPWDMFLSGFMMSAWKSRLQTELDQDAWARLEYGIHGQARMGWLTYSNVRGLVRGLGSDVQGHAVRRLVERFGYELQR